MNLLREKAISLRKEGKSYSEINKIFGVPKSTLSNWLSHVVLSKKAKNRVSRRMNKGSIGLIKRNVNQTVLAVRRAEEIKKNAMDDIKQLSDNDLLIIGSTLYWAEGYKRLKIKNGKEITSHIVALTNSDPDIVCTFVYFLKKILNVPNEKIYIEMRLFRHIEAKAAIVYWMSVTGLPEEQFNKPMYPVSKASKGKRPQNRLPYGTVRVIVSDTKLFHKVIGLIEGLKEKLRLINH